jgi:hypothetical protein
MLTATVTAVSGAAVPRDGDNLAEGLGRHFRHHNHRPTAFEERILERRLGDRGELIGLFDDDQVVDPAEHADDGVLPPVLLAPGGARAVIGGGGRPGMEGRVEVGGIRFPTSQVLRHFSGRKPPSAGTRTGHFPSLNRSAPGSADP